MLTEEQSDLENAPGKPLKGTYNVFGVTAVAILWIVGHTHLVAPSVTWCPKQLLVCLRDNTGLGTI